MFRTFFIAGALLAASGTAFAGSSHVYGSVVSVDPAFAVSYGSGPYNSGFSVTYSSGGYPYWGGVPYYRPAPVVVVPAPYYRVYAVPPGHAYRHGYGPGYGHGKKGDHYRHEGRHHRH